jgi:hypothetical protein
MRTDDTTTLDRKAWRRLVELRLAGRITRAALQRLKGLLAHDRPATPATPATPAAPRAPPRLTLLQGGGQPPPSPPSPPTPSPLEVA